MWGDGTRCKENKTAKAAIQTQFSKDDKALGFIGNTFLSTRLTRQGIELMHMIKKGQMVSANGQNLSAAAQCYALAS